MGYALVAADAQGRRRHVAATAFVLEVVGHGDELGGQSLVELDSGAGLAGDRVVEPVRDRGRGDGHRGVDEVAPVGWYAFGARGPGGERHIGDPLGGVLER